MVTSEKMLSLVTFRMFSAVQTYHFQFLTFGHSGTYG